MPEFKTGQRVHVEYDGVVTQQAGHYAVEIQTDAGAYLTTNVSYVTATDPANWPPQIGDIWELDGEEYFIKQSTGYPNKQYVSPSTGRAGFYTNGDRAAEFKNSNPTLIRRRGDASHYRLFGQDGK